MSSRRVAFVLNMDANGLGVSRSLGIEGIPVVGVDFRKGIAGLRSRCIRPLVCPNPIEEPQESLDLLLAEGRRLDDKGILYPTSDAFTLLVSRHRRELGEAFDFMLPPEDIVEGMVNKRLQYDEAKRLGMPLPSTFYPGSMDDLDGIRDELEYPAIIKPIYSHLLSSRIGKGIKVDGPSELKERYKRVFEVGMETLVQSCVIGPNTNHVKVCGYYGRDGDPHAVFLTRKLRQFPPEFGIGTLMESTHDGPLQALGERFFRGIGYRGVGSIEFKKDERDGQCKMIELNARFWLQNVQAMLAGVNFPLIEYRELTEGIAGEPPPWRDGVTWVDMVEDARSFWWYRKRGMAEYRRLIPAWLDADCHAYLSRTDLRPALSQSGYGIGIAKLVGDLLRMERKKEFDGNVLRLQ